MRGVFLHPLTTSWAPPPSVPPLSGDGNPYKQGESAVRDIHSSKYLLPIYINMCVGAELFAFVNSMLQNLCLILRLVTFENQ